MGRGSMDALTVWQRWGPSCTLGSCSTDEKMPLKRIQSRWCSRHGDSGKRHPFEGQVECSIVPRVTAPVATYVGLLDSWCRLRTRLLRRREKCPVSKSIYTYTIRPTEARSTP